MQLQLAAFKRTCKNMSLFCTVAKGARGAENVGHAQSRRCAKLPTTNASQSQQKSKLVQVEENVYWNLFRIKVLLEGNPLFSTDQ